MRTGEVDISHELLSLLGELALPTNILNIWCHHIAKSDLFNSYNWIRYRRVALFPSPAARWWGRPDQPVTRENWNPATVVGSMP